MQLIDIHAHVYPDDIAPKATKSVRDFYQVPCDAMDGTVQTLLERGTRAGISRFLILPVAIRPDRVRGINQYILEQTRLQSRFIGFGTVHAAMAQLDGEIDWITASGLRGIKMHPDSQRFSIDDLRLFPLYESIQGRLPLLLHMGDQRYDYSHPVKLRRILDLFPRLQVIAAHFGGYSMYETAYEFLKDKDCIFDVSSSLMFMQEGLAEKYIRAYGAERMAFGTDYPMWDPVKEADRFFRLQLTPEHLEQIGRKTACRVLNIIP